MAKGESQMISEIINAVKAGNELKDPAKWKKGQMLTNTIGAVVAGAIVLIKWKFPELPIPDGLQGNLVEIICGVLVAVNLYLIPATSKKIGV
jgi:hypothetical protein